MMTGNFDNDYIAGAHPEVLRALVETNLERTHGYGDDPYTRAAQDLIRQACNLTDAEVWLMTGGTQTNATVIDALLRQSQGVMCADCGHINVHEAGAIEASGHKVIALPHDGGIVSAKTVTDYLTEFQADETHPHMVEPKMLYLTHPTEYGRLYRLSELEALSRLCRDNGIYLYVDGARMGYALAAYGTDVTLPDLARLCDAFYIGGTKCGALFGEAVVARPGILHRFFSVMKMHGAVLAKGRLLGLQFRALFTDGLYLRICRTGIEAAHEVVEIMREAGYAPCMASDTNQQFFRLPNELIDKLRQTLTFEDWGPRGERESTVRFVTSWSTTPADLAALRHALGQGRGSTWTLT